LFVAIQFLNIVQPVKKSYAKSPFLFDIICVSKVKTINFLDFALGGNYAAPLKKTKKKGMTALGRKNAVVLPRVFFCFFKGSA
jgi:hypothetical protein